MLKGLRVHTKRVYVRRRAQNRTVLDFGARSGPLTDGKISKVKKANLYSAFYKLLISKALSRRAWCELHAGLLARVPYRRKRASMSVDARLRTSTGASCDRRRRARCEWSLNDDNHVLCPRSGFAYATLIFTT